MTRYKRQYVTSLPIWHKRDCVKKRKDEEPKSALPVSLIVLIEGGLEILTSFDDFSIQISQISLRKKTVLLLNF